MRNRPLFATRQLFAAALALTIWATPSAYAEDATTRANRSAYQAALKCFVANGIAVGDARDARNAERANASDTMARKSFDTAKKLGSLLGYSGDRMQQDFSLAQTYELPRMMKDLSYYRDAAATCKALGLM